MKNAGMAIKIYMEFSANRQVPSDLESILFHGFEVALDANGLPVDFSEGVRSWSQRRRDRQTGGYSRKLPRPSLLLQPGTAALRQQAMRVSVSQVKVCSSRREEALTGSSEI